MEHVENSTERDGEDKRVAPDAGNEDIPAEVLTPHHHGESPASVRGPGEEEECSVNEEFMAKAGGTSEQPLCAVVEVSSDDRAPASGHLESSEGESSGPPQGEEEDGGEPTAGCDQILRGLYEERDAARRRGGLLQRRLAAHFCKRDDAQPRRGPAVPGEYEERLGMAADLRQRQSTVTKMLQQQSEELKLQSQHRLDQVRSEWRSFMARKQEVAASLLGRHLGKRAAEAAAEAAVASEQLRHDALVELRLEHARLRTRVRGLLAELDGGGGGGAGDPLQLHFEQLRAEKLERKQEAERRSEECLKLQKKIRRSLELLSNVKEKLHWSQTEVRAKREHLAELEATLARRRDLLARTKQASGRLRADNSKLRGRRGLLGSRVLLRDFEDTVDSSQHLDVKLVGLKCRHAGVARQVREQETFQRPDVGSQSS